MMTTERIALIDGDILVYQVSAPYAIWEIEGFLFNTRSEALEFKDVLGTETTPKKIGQYDPNYSIIEERIESSINKIVENTHATEYIVYLTEEGEKTNFRKELATIQPYKGHRTQPKPNMYYDARKILVNIYGAKVSSGQEADDDIGIRHYQSFVFSKKSPENQIQTVFCSRDKDRLTIPGLSYDPFTSTLRYISELAADYYFYKQILTGDTADNIPGIKGVGETRAFNILQKLDNSDDMYQAVLKVYKDTYGDKAEKILLEVGRLLRIRRWENEIWELPYEKERSSN